MHTHISYLRKLIVAVLLACTGCATQPDSDSLLIKGASVIDSASAMVHENQCIWITDSRIERVCACPDNATAAQVVDAGGRWIIPGLWDMHVHALWDSSAYRDFFEDFVAYGVVGIRDMGGVPAVVNDARQYLANPDNIGPEFVAAGHIIDGPTPLHQGIAVGAVTAEDGASAVAELHAMGSDFIKIYTLLPKSAAIGVFEEARKLGLQVVGHLPGEIELSEAIAGGLASIEHMAVEIGGLCDVNDSDSCVQTFEAIRSANIHLTPTLLVRQRPGSVLDPATLEAARINDMPEVLAAEWTASLERSRQNKTPSYLAQKKAQYLQEQRLTEIAIAANSLILVGTDTGDFLIPPGSSIHEELELLVGAGMTEYEAILAATGRATEFLGLDDHGQISVGNFADLIILRSNPLDDIRNTRDIDAIVLNGRLLNSSTLECLKSSGTCDQPPK